MRNLTDRSIALLGSVVGALSLSVVSLEIFPVHVNVRIGLDQPTIGNPFAPTSRSANSGAVSPAHSSTENADEEIWNCENGCKCRSEYVGNGGGVPTYHLIPVSCN
jgi:hypothetical protein